MGLSFQRDWNVTGTLHSAEWKDWWLRPPDIYLKGDRLCWKSFTLTMPRAESFRVMGRRWSLQVADHGYKTEATERLLDDFMELADANDEKILNYARRYGVLGICKHNVPATHNVRIRSFWGDITPGPAKDGSAVHEGTNDKECAIGTVKARVKPAGYRGCSPRGGKPNQGWEPLERWHFFAKRAREMVEAADNLRSGDPAWRRVWRGIVGVKGRLLRPQRPQRLSTLRKEAISPKRSKEERHARLRDALASSVSCWLEMGGVGVECYWTGAHPVIRIGSASLFGALAKQLLFRVCGIHNVAPACSFCGRAYIPSRRPSPTRLNYCSKEDCQKAAAAARARKSRARKAKKAGPLARPRGTI